MGRQKRINFMVVAVKMLLVLQFSLEGPLIIHCSHFRVDICRIVTATELLNPYLYNTFKLFSLD